MNRLFKAAIRWYQRRISPGLPRRCRYEPTCSQYALEAIEIHGAFKGTLLGIWRILRCNPWSKGGVNWVPQPGRWRSRTLGLKELLAQRAQESQEQQSSSDHLGHGDEAVVE